MGSAFQDKGTFIAGVLSDLLVAFQLQQTRGTRFCAPFPWRLVLEASLQNTVPNAFQDNVAIYMTGVKENAPMRGTHGEAHRYVRLKPTNKQTTNNEHKTTCVMLLLMIFII